MTREVGVADIFDPTTPAGAAYWQERHDIEARWERRGQPRPGPRPYHYAPADVRQLIADGAPPETVLFHMTPAEVEHVFLDLATAYEQARVKAGYDLGRMPSLAELVAAVVKARVVAA